MPDSGVVQIPFSAFKLINLDQTLGLEIYQQLYNDNAEPIGVIAIVQSLGLLRPSDKAVDCFNSKWTRESASWKFRQTGIEVVTGRSSTSGFMAKTREGEAAVMVLSLLLECMDSQEVSEVVRRVIDTTPGELVQIKPRKMQIKNVVTALESQTSCVSWQEEIEAAELAVFEHPQIWTPVAPLPSASFDISHQSMAAYFQALCTVTNFPDFHCTLETGGSIVVPFLLAHTVCGLRVCVTVNGELAFGNASSDAWQVRLEKIPGQSQTRVKIGKRLEDVQELLVLEDNEVGKLRANRVAINRVGKAVTTGQHLDEKEANNIAKLALSVATWTLANWNREVLDYSDTDSSVDYESDSSVMDAEASEASGHKDYGKVKRRLTAQAVSLWWGCSEPEALKMMDEAVTLTTVQPTGASWRSLHYPQRTLANIADFEALCQKDQMQRRSLKNKPQSREDYASIVHTLTTHVLLISFLCFNETSMSAIRVRSSSDPRNSAMGKTLACMKDPKPLGQSDILGSWYHWIKGSSPKSLDNVDVFVVDGFLVYRNLLLQLDLSPNACETIVVEAGHLQFQDCRADVVRSAFDSATIIGSAAVSSLNGPCKLRAKDKTGHVNARWSVDEVQGTLELGITLKCANSGIQVDTSISTIAKRAWSLLYGDKSIGCSHEEDYVGRLIEGQTLDELVPGSLFQDRAYPVPDRTSKLPPGYRTVKLYRAHGNDLGQIACLMSGSEKSQGFVRRDACLRCCVSFAQREGLDFVVD
ncbi:hypothetical protein BCR34DRAFT_598754 [Clohesyomyces aquaticus]|uniref:Uncharacterized protein n=1 Tax=Clohesyomyces aquaticus TaxID=1231657 RepID=A0A1Y1ZXS2_9PLEO|nr:hypothetical protein BCR34DRAFT_598754 [Clohesyomyces aquaticus]